MISLGIEMHMFQSHTILLLRGSLHKSNAMSQRVYKNLIVWIVMIREFYHFEMIFVDGPYRFKVR